MVLAFCLRGSASEFPVLACFSLGCTGISLWPLPEEEDDGRAADPIGVWCSWTSALACLRAVQAEKMGQGGSSLAGLNWRFLVGNGSLVPFECCQWYILVAPDNLILLAVPNVLGAVQAQPSNPASARSRN